MALLKLRREDVIEQGFYMDETAEAGTVAVFSTGGSGVSMDDSAALATLSASPSGKVAIGVLLMDVVNYDLTKQKSNYLRPETQKGSKVPLMKRGMCVTNKIIGTPAAGNTCYLHNSGNVSATQLSGAPTLGVFMSSPDADGYAKIEINLP